MFVGVSRENHVSLGIGLIKCDCVCQGHFQLPFVSLSVKTLRPRYESHPSSSVSHQRRHSRERQYRQWPPSSNQRSVCKGGDLSMNNLPLPSPGRLPPLSQGSEEAKIAMFECPITFSHPSWIGDIFSLRGRIWVAFPEKVDRSMSENIAVQSVPRRSSAWGCFTISLIEFRQQQATGCTAWCQQSGYVSIVHAPPQNLENTCLRERERERRGGGGRGRERERDDLRRTKDTLSTTPIPPTFSVTSLHGLPQSPESTLTLTRATSSHLDLPLANLLQVFSSPKFP